MDPQQFGVHMEWMDCRWWFGSFRNFWILFEALPAKGICRRSPRSEFAKAHSFANHLESPGFGVSYDVSSSWLIRYPLAYIGITRTVHEQQHAHSLCFDVTRCTVPPRCTPHPAACSITVPQTKGQTQDEGHKKIEKQGNHRKPAPPPKKKGVGGNQQECMSQ